VGRKVTLAPAGALALATIEVDSGSGFLMNCQLTTIVVVAAPETVGAKPGGNEIYPAIVAQLRPGVGLAVGSSLTA